MNIVCWLALFVESSSALTHVHGVRTDVKLGLWFYLEEETGVRVRVIPPSLLATLLGKINSLSQSTRLQDTKVLMAWSRWSTPAIYMFYINTSKI